LLDQNFKLNLLKPKKERLIFLNFFFVESQERL
jgi:hypothetical protein